MQAVIQLGKKQYLVKQGDLVTLDRLNKKEGEKIIFEEILLTFDEKEQMEIGDPVLKAKKVEGEIVKHFQKKVLVVKKHPKKRYKLKKGYKQAFTQVKITKVA